MPKFPYLEGTPVTFIWHDTAFEQNAFVSTYVVRGVCKRRVWGRYCKTTADRKAIIIVHDYDLAGDDSTQDVDSYPLRDIDFSTIRRIRAGK